MSTYLDALNSMTATTGTDTNKTSSSTTLGKEAFLQLLVTQMQYQDPMNPMQNEDYVAQMAQFSSLEQLMNMNDTMNQVALIDSSLNNSQAVNLIGKTITVAGNTVQIDGGAVGGAKYTLADNADTVSVMVNDANGKLVRTVNLSSQTAGNHDFTFDGKDSDGNTLPDGDYTFTVTAKTAAGDSVDVATFSTVKVEGLTFDNGIAYLLSGESRFKLSDVYEVYSD